MRESDKMTGILLALFFLASCSASNLPAQTYSKCAPVSSLKLNKESKKAIAAALTLRIDTRRRKYNADDFCAYNEPSSNGNYGLLTIYDEVGNHTTKTWVLLSKSQALDTQFSEYEMAKVDSVVTNTLIISWVNRLAGIDNTARNELVGLMNQKARQERNRKL